MHLTPRKIRWEAFKREEIRERVQPQMCYDWQEIAMDGTT